MKEEVGMRERKLSEENGNIYNNIKMLRYITV